MTRAARCVHTAAAIALALLGLTIAGGERGEASASPAEGVPAELTAESSTPCEVVEADRPLPDVVRETSGLARSARDPMLFWTHNDAGNDPDIFAVDAAGRLVQQVRVTGAELVDWEDMESAPCTDGRCLYIADIGDNDAEREHITIYRVAEPEAAATETAPAQALHATFPDGPRDAEALFAGPAGELYLINKGRKEAIALYRYPSPGRPGETATLERVRSLFPEPRQESGRVTAATASPSGRWVGIRTYDTLYLYRTEQLLDSAELKPEVIDLSPLAEAQGEALVLDDDGTVWVTSEAEDNGDTPRWTRIRCSLPPMAP